MNANRRQALHRAVDLGREEAQTLEDIQAGLESIQRREGIELDERHRQLRAKHLREIG